MGLRTGGMVLGLVMTSGDGPLGGGHLAHTNGALTGTADEVVGLLAVELDE